MGRSSKVRAEIRPWVRKADAAVRAVAIYRDGPKCLTCGTTQDLTASHYIRADVYGLRWDPANVYIQCRSCNAIHNLNPEPFRAAILARTGPGTFEYLNRRYFDLRASSWKPTPEDLAALVEALTLYPLRKGTYS